MIFVKGICALHVQSALMDVFGKVTHYVTIHTSEPLHIKGHHKLDKICQNLFSCDPLEPDGTLLKPLGKQIQLYIPVNENLNHFLELEIQRDDETLVFHPHHDGLKRLLDSELPKAAKDQIRPHIKKLENHLNFDFERQSLSLFSNDHDELLQQSNHHSDSHATRIYKRNMILKRDVRRSDGFKNTTNTIVKILGGLGYSTKRLFGNVKMLFDWSAYLDTMEFIKFYYDKAWAVVWQSFPIMQNKLATFMAEQKNTKLKGSELDSRIGGIKNPIEEVKKLNETSHSVDMRVLFAQHISKHAVTNNNWTDTLGDTAGDIYEQVLPFYDDIPDLTAVFNATKNIKKQDLFGFLDNSRDILIDASTIVLLKSFKYVQISNRYFEKATDFRFKFPGSKTIENTMFQGRFDLNLANMYHMATAVACYHMFFAKYQTAPITKEDVVSFKKAPSAMNIFHVWLKDPYSGTPTPWKEYRLRSIIDWFPRLYFGLLMSYITICFEFFGDTEGHHWSKTLIPRVVLAINAAMFVPTAFPVDMIEGQTNADRFKQLNKLFPPGFIVGYGWNLMSVFVLLRPGMHLMDSVALKAKTPTFFTKYIHNDAFRGAIGKRNAMELIWENIKAVVFGVPQTYGLLHLINLMKGRVHWNDLAQSGMFGIQAGAWTLDILNNWSPLLRGFNKGFFDNLQGFTGRWMNVLYLSRSYWEVAHGMPAMFFYYQSYFTPSQNLTERVIQIRERIPQFLHKWQDVHDPDNEAILKKSGIKFQ